MFENMKNLIEIDLSYFDTSLVTTSSFMFYNCLNLTSVKLSNTYSINLKNISYMFQLCSNLIYINFGNINTSLVEDMQFLFSQCSKIESIDLSKFDTSKVTTMFAMFRYCYNLKELNLNNFVTSLVTNMRSMFYSCNEMISIDLSSFNTSQVTTMKWMFQGCFKLSSINILNFDLSNVVDIYAMFSNCKTLETINFGNVNTPSLENIELLFQGCTDLKSIDLSKFNTAKINSMSSMFAQCQNLESINFGNIDTSSVQNMSSLFYGCSKLKTIDLSSFNTTQVTTFQCMFSNCSNLRYLNLSNFKTSNMNSMFQMFEGCSSLLHLNIYLFKLDNSVNIAYAFKDIFPNVTYCIYDNYTKEYLLGPNTNSICYKECHYDNYGLFCDDNILINSESIIIRLIPSSSYSNVIIECQKVNSSNNNCKFLNIKNDTEIMNVIQENINFLFEGDKSQVIKSESGVVFQITNTKNEKELLESNNLNNQYLSIIDLNGCENKLKTAYHINNNDSLIYLKQEKTNVKSSEKDIKYEIFEPFNFTKLNLSICEDETINLYVPIELSEETIETYEQLKLLGYNMFNINDPFYQDLCTPFNTKNDTDIPLSARKEYIYNNKDSKCQSNCQFSSYLANSLYINCTCSVGNVKENNEQKFSGKKLYESFYDVLIYANFKILKCYKLVFNKDIFNSNFGNLIILSIFINYIICLIIYINKGILSLKNKIKELKTKKKRKEKIIRKALEILML